jgi:hypothetical protein
VVNLSDQLIRDGEQAQRSATVAALKQPAFRNHGRCNSLKLKELRQDLWTPIPADLAEGIGRVDSDGQIGEPRRCLGVVSSRNWPSHDSGWSAAWHRPLKNKDGPDVSKCLSIAIALTIATSVWASLPPYVSRIGDGTPTSGTGAQGFTSLHPNATATTPGIGRTGGRGGSRGGLGNGGYRGGSFGGSVGYGRNGVRPPIPAPPNRLGGYRGFRR